MMLFLFMEKKGAISSKLAFFMTVVIVLVILGIGLIGIIGAYLTDSSGGECDLGFQELFCWKWHNVEIIETVESVLPLILT